MNKLNAILAASNAFFCAWFAVVMTIQIFLGSSMWWLSAIGFVIGAIMTVRCIRDVED
jgi:hypothetical protein